MLLDKLLHAHDTDRSSTEISAEKHQIYDKEFKEYKNELEQYKKQQELEKSINEEKFHLTQRDNLMKYNENMVKILEEKAKKSRDTYNDIYNQISERVVTKKTNLLNERSKDLEMINKYDDKDSKFRDYALVMCEEWAKDGRDVRAFINALNEKKAKVKGIGANHLDTFSRLGF